MDNTGTLAIAFYQGVPKLVEVIAITGKRAKLRRPNSPAMGEVRSLPVSELFEYDEEIWNALQTFLTRIANNKAKIEETSRGLKPLIASLKAKAGGVDDDFWS